MGIISATDIRSDTIRQNAEAESKRSQEKAQQLEKSAIKPKSVSKKSKVKTKQVAPRKAAEPARKAAEPARKGVEAPRTKSVAEPSDDRPSIERQVMRLALEATNAGLQSGAIESGDPAQIATEVKDYLLSNTQTKDLFVDVLPRITAFVDHLGAEKSAQIMGSTGKVLAESGQVKAMLHAANEVGGVPGRRMMGAALRGYSKGGAPNVVIAELASTAAKIGASEAGKRGAANAAKALSVAAPVLGDAANIACAATGFVDAIKTTRDETVTTKEKVASWLKLTASVAGMVLPMLVKTAAAVA